MNFNKLFAMQKELDEKILNQHKLHNENLTSRKILALLVEVGELANETRCFKFWSLKAAAPVETILEEYVDGVHFILSLGLDLDVGNEIELTPLANEHSVNEQFLQVYRAIADFEKNQTKDAYITLFQEYIHLGSVLGFSAEQIEKAYVSKNEINHQRQEQGY
ncbi:dUTP diphosphatase [Metabacillus fastidiosus]|uniref:dUTP diphosphatase n=1 Tax=Metabacillus fastidiosus TaxID=1458 RepID=A0ABU6NWY1_9BACI|nr:dUTP diphosphatase [Metabacillus fastidiosus]MED4401158.1 dUTP diphosphatase [Metabacillus fastidiosus]MED4464085.1 dUTP diphosphatase [Metabacillus fastidiosus]